MDAAEDSGVNFFDTSNSYGRHPRPGPGRADHRRVVQPVGGDPRSRTVLATKVFEATDDANRGGLSALNIRRALDALRPSADGLHRPVPVPPRRPETPWDEIWQAVDVAASQGKILYAGSSNFASWHLAQASSGGRRGLIGLVSEQSIYNLLKRDVELEVLPAAQAYWSRFSGLGAVARGDPGRRSARATGKRRRSGGPPRRWTGTVRSWPGSRTWPANWVTGPASWRWAGCWLSQG